MIVINRQFISDCFSRIQMGIICEMIFNLRLQIVIFCSGKLIDTGDDKG